jgi:hypothetical protein
MLRLQLLAVQPDTGNNIYLAETAVRDFLVHIPPNLQDQLRTLESLDTDIAGLMQRDHRTAKLLEIVRAFIRSQIDRLSTSEAPIA